MKITLLVIGKTGASYLREGIDLYLSRLKHYVHFYFVIIPELRNTKYLSEAKQKEEEAHLIVKHLNANQYIVLLDEKGKTYTSKIFATYLEKHMVGGLTDLVFIIGGPYGFHESLYQRAQQRISLSDMTFSHQMVRLFFVEQLYRAFTILRGEPYHHD